MELFTVLIVYPPAKGVGVQGYPLGHLGLRPSPDPPSIS